MKIFSNAHWFNRPANSELFHEDVDFVSIIPAGVYVVKLYHTACGIGSSDKYEYLTFVEVSQDGVDATLEIFQEIGIRPFNDVDHKTLSKLISYLVIK